MFAAGQVIAFAGSASDSEDGVLTGSLQWSSSIDGAIGRGGSFARPLSPGTHRIAAKVVDSGGQVDAKAITVMVAAPIAMTFPVAADTYVQSSKLGGKYGINKKLLVGSFPERNTLLRFTVAGVSPFSVKRAVVRLTANPGRKDGSVAGGSLCTVASTSWGETTTSYKNCPAMDGPVMATAGAVVPDQVVDFDVSPAVQGDGTYSFGLESTSTDSVVYRSRESKTGKPQLIVTLGPPNIVLTGEVAKYQTATLYPDTRIDARAATFFASPLNIYPINLAGGPGAVFTGGTVLGQFDRSWTWEQMHDLNNAAIAFDNASFTVDGLRADNVTDGIRPEKEDNFTVREVHLSYVRDDCIENDHLLGGLVDDSLLDGCYSAFSARPSQAIIDSGYNGAAKVWTIQNTLVRLQAMPGPNAPTADGLGHAGFFKWHKWDDPANSLSPKLALHNNVFMAERVGDVGPDRMGIPPTMLAGCSNNVMVWLGPGSFPSALPPCFTVTTDRAVWDNAVADWITRHPGAQP
jgi:hypothetical protein